MALRTVPLGELATFVRGVTFKPTDVSSTGVSVLRTKNVQATLDLSDVMRIPPNLIKRADQYLRAGDTLISSANSWNLVGKCCWIPPLDEPAAVGGFVTALRPGPDIHARYLYYWFSSPRIQATARSFGNQTTNISNLSLSRCLEMAVPLPSMDEQRRIADILDRADTLRAKRREAVVLIDDLTESIFLDMFGDPAANNRGYQLRPLIEWIDPARPITYGILKPGDDRPDGVPYVRVLDMKDRGIDPSGLRRTSVEISHQYKRSLLRSGDLLISIRGHVGRLAEVPEGANGANITQDSARLAVSPDSRMYVMECLRTGSMQYWMRQRTKGAAVQGINLGDLKVLPVPAPPIGQQRLFADRAAAVIGVRRAAERQLALADETFVSLQQQAFAGML